MKFRHALIKDAVTGQDSTTFRKRKLLPFNRLRMLNLHVYQLQSVSKEWGSNLDLYLAVFSISFLFIWLPYYENLI